ncbi:MAG: GNAT family N-acetyltransferase [Proteobacteria bacterium]|nr:GNAT family N-acetyltransferase [Pseudomonadota bacterium]
MKWSCLSFDELDVRTLYDLLALRQEVFVVEQDCPYLDADGFDQSAMHLLGHDDDGELVAYCRLFEPGFTYTEACIGRVVTSAKIRGKGLGRPLMRQAMGEVARLWGSVPVKLSAQAHLEPYYSSLGFRVCGEGYLEDGIPHLPMRAG